MPHRNKPPEADSEHERQLDTLARLLSAMEAMSTTIGRQLSAVMSDVKWLRKSIEAVMERQTSLERDHHRLAERTGRHATLIEDLERRVVLLETTTITTTVTKEKQS